MKKMDSYLKLFNKVSIEDLSYEYIYKELICHENRNVNGCVKDILRIFADMIDTDKKYIKLVDNKIVISNIDEIDYSKKKIELSIFNKLDNVHKDLDMLINYCNKKKIKFSGKFEVYDNVGYLSMLFTDIDGVLMVIDYVNSKLNKNIYNVNPLFFSSGDVMISLDCEYSYIEILSMYLYKFILKMRELKLDVDYSNFKDYMVDNYFKIDNQIDMYQFLEFNNRDIKLSKFFRNIDEITNIIIYLFNGNDYDDFKDYFRKLSRKNGNISNKYEIYDNMDECSILLEELVKNMYFSYGDEYTKESIINYMNTGKGDYITRKDNLRKRVMNSKVFMIYLRKINIEIEIDRLIDMFRFEKKVKILENICKEIYLTYLDDDNNIGKIQVARGLIRMQYGDYSTITRNNNARKMAIENIDSLEVIKLIKSSLGIDSVKKEEELYELYAEYIENICVS